MAVPSDVGPLTFEDEFDGLVLDPTKWAHRAPGPRLDGFNSPDTVSVGGGVLTMKVYTETVLGQQVHFSGQIATTNLFEQTYGYFETRARFNTTPGQWSAFWLQSPTIGADPNDPEGSGVEMDIFEHRVNNSFDFFNYPGLTPTTDISNRVNQAMIWNGYNNPNQQSRVQLSNPLPGLENNSLDWHTFGLLWKPDGYTFFVDGVPTWDGGGAPISERSQYFILSTEIANFFAGQRPAEGFGTAETTTTNFQVDYVRAYAIPEPSGLAVALAGALSMLFRRTRPVSRVLKRQEA